MFLISSYGTPLAQRASYLALQSSLFGPDSTVDYDYIITNTNSINSLLIGSRGIPNLAHASKHTHTLVGWYNWPSLTCRYMYRRIFRNSLYVEVTI